MLRRSLILAALVVTTFFANGCQSCSSCHDYDSPVANCECGHCPQCDCNGGCSSCGCSGESSSSGGYMQPGEAVEATPVEGQAVAPHTKSQQSQQPSGAR